LSETSKFFSLWPPFVHVQDYMGYRLLLVAIKFLF